MLIRRNRDEEDLQSPVWVRLVVLGVVLLGLALYGYWKLAPLLRADELRTTGSTVPGTVTSASGAPIGKDAGMLKWTVAVHYEFEVNDQKYTGYEAGRSPRYLATGQKVHVTYDPANPAKNHLAEIHPGAGGFAKFQTTMLIIGGGAIGLIAVIVILRARAA